MYIDPYYLACIAAWLVLWAYWIVSLRSQKREKAAESGGARLGEILPMVVCYTLLFSPGARVGWLRLRVLPSADWIEGVAMLTAVAGVALAIWARHDLGTNWSARVSIRDQHELIQSGPYRRIRHPIYTGMMLGAIGTAGVVGEVRGVAAVLVMIAAFYVKSRREERWLGREFGADLAPHMRRTGMFLPKLW